VSTVCSNVTQASLNTVANPPSLYYISNFSKGSAYQLGNPGINLPCSTLATTSQYITSLCSLFSDTGIATAPYQNGNYYPYISAGNSSTLGSLGTAVPCSVPGTGQYTTSICTATTDTVIATVPQDGNYYPNLSKGNAYQLGSLGIAVPCSVPVPGTRQYTTSICTSTTNTVIADKVLAPATGYYYSGFSHGDAYTLGNLGTVASCSTAPYGKYTTSICTSTTNTVFSTPPYQDGYYYQYISAGNATTLGSLGLRYRCSVPGTNQYTQSICTSTTNTVIYNMPNAPGYYYPGYSRGDEYTLGNRGAGGIMCTQPGTGQYTTSICTLASDTVFSTPPYQDGYYYPYMSRGTSATLGSLGTAVSCSVPGNNQYTASICTGTTNTVIFTLNPATGYYYSGYSQGTAYTLGTKGTGTTCTQPGTGQYTTSTCTLTSDTVVATPPYQNGKYYPYMSAGNSSTLGSLGTAVSCSVPGNNQYTASICTGTTNTGISTLTLANGNYYSGYFKGDAYTLGTTGTRTPCTQPGASQYITSLCTTLTDTVIATVPQDGNYYPYMSAGTSTALGSLGTVRACSVPGNNQYTYSICTGTTNTGISTLTPVTGYYYSGYFKGDAYTLGSATRTPCTQPGYGQYTTSTCTLTSDTGIATPPYQNGKYYPYISAGTSTALGRLGTAVPCSVPGTGQYTYSICTATTNTGIANAPGGYYPNFSQGNAYTLGRLF